MRRLARLLLAVYVLTIPWEYSLDLGAPWGNVARVVGLLLLATALPALLSQPRPRAVGWAQGLVLALYLWLCLSFFWSIQQLETVAKLRAFFQEMMIVFLAWEFVRSARDLRWLVRATVAGCWILALLTLAQLRSVEALAAEQLRTAAYGQDPNDVARFLDLGMPLAALLGRTEPHAPARWLALLYLPAALLATLLTASRGGLLAALIALTGCALLVLQGRPELQRATAFTAPALLALGWVILPAGVLQRLATIPEQLQSGNLNQRINIWRQGWQAFEHAPWAGYGAGNFALAAGVRPEDTAHNTALALLLAGGIVALLLATVLFALCLQAAWRLRSSLRVALLTALAVFAVTSMVASVEENRLTWLLVALIALAARLSAEAPHALATCFAPATPPPVTVPASAVSPLP